MGKLVNKGRCSKKISEKRGWSSKLVNKGDVVRKLAKKGRCSKKISE